MNEKLAERFGYFFLFWYNLRLLATDVAAEWTYSVSVDM